MADSSVPILQSLSDGETLVSTASNRVSSMNSAMKTPSTNNNPTNAAYNGSIKQTERLLTTRTRGIGHQDGGGNRGQRTFIKLLSSNPAKSLSQHLTGSDQKTSSIGTSSGGALSNALNSANGYDEFLITDMRCNLDEKLQITQVMGDAEISYYFGRQPISFEFNGILIDSPDNNWFLQFVEMYTEIMRGTQLARNYELVKIVLPSMTLIGSMHRLNYTQNSQRDADIPFSFSFLAKQIIPTPTVAPGKPMTNLPVIDFSKVSGFLSQAGINDIKVKSLADLGNGLRNVITNPLSTLSDYSGALNGIGQGMSSFGSSLGMTQIGSLSVGANSTIGSFGGGDGNPITSALSGVTSLFAGVTANLSGIRASLFSPIFGVLSSLTKLIKNVAGTISAVIGAFVNPIRDILRDIRNISNQAIAVVNLVTNSIHGFTNQIRNLDTDIRNTLSTLKKTAGVIMSAPYTISESIRELFNAGKLPATTRWLATGGNPIQLPNGSWSAGKMALLNSGPRHTPEAGARL